MRYLCLTYRGRAAVDDPPYDDPDPPTRPFLIAGALQPVETGSVVRARDGTVSVTEGPVLETNGQLSGFFLLEARDLNEAILIASNTAYARGGSVEVRPIVEPDARQP
jgi:hypothetical protein